MVAVRADHREVLDILRVLLKKGVTEPFMFIKECCTISFKLFFYSPSSQILLGHILLEAKNTQLVLKTHF